MRGAAPTGARLDNERQGEREAAEQQTLLAQAGPLRESEVAEGAPAHRGAAEAAY